MRILLFTGKGGVGKTTVAAGTAVLAARRGLKTLVVSADAAHSLADVVGVPAGWSGGGEPYEVEPGLFLAQVDARGRAERSWREVQDYLLALLDAAGVDPVEAEELTVLPGAEEVLALLELRDHARSGRWDLVVVDCAPTAETLRLLALPDALRWYIDRFFPLERRVARALRPVLGRAAGVPAPKERVLDAIGRLHEELVDVRALLTEPGTSVRLVTTPDDVVLAETRRTLTSLALYGYRVDAVVANRLVPAGDDPWRAAWASAQAGRLAGLERDVAPLPVLRGPYGAGEPVGADPLAALAEQLYGGTDPAAPADDVELVSVERSGDEFVLVVPLPLAERENLALARSGDELVLTVGPHRRVLALPAALTRCTVAGAVLREGRLRVRFEPDPALWRTP
ncbi:MAG: ArsA family ATPase [Motilibacteraceae bacterium]